MNRDGELAIYSVYYAEDGTVKGYSASPPPLLLVRMMSCVTNVIDT
jgi:hypothetical protein